MFARLVYFVFAAAATAGTLLQAYLLLYPYVRSGCSWESGAAVRLAAFGDPQIAGWWPRTLRKRVDIAGNDLFLQQVVATVRRTRQPDFVAVLGDLISSQWIATPEFDERADRFAAIFPTAAPGTLVNVTGNHDIGYHGEMTDERLARYRRRYGELNFVAHATDSWRLVVLNSLALDGPPTGDAPQQETLQFLGELRAAQFAGTTVLLTHVPMYKEAGICRDGPHFEYYGPEHGSVLREQNHLSAQATQLVLDSVFGTGAGGIVLAGHDHEGCEASYLRRDGTWVSEPGFSDGNAVKEATVRSVMGEYGGNAGLVSGVWDGAARQLRWHFSLCQFHVQHLWWVAQITTAVALLLLPVVIVV